MVIRFILKKIEQFYGLKMVHFILEDLKKVKEKKGKVMSINPSIIIILDILVMEKRMGMDSSKQFKESNTMENG